MNSKTPGKNCTRVLAARGESPTSRVTGAVGADARRPDAGDVCASARRGNEADGPAPPVTQRAPGALIPLAAGGSQSPVRKHWVPIATPKLTSAAADRLQPGSTDIATLSVLSQQEWQEGNRERAIELAEQGVRLDSENPLGHRTLHLFYKQVGRNEEAARGRKRVGEAPARLRPLPGGSSRSRPGAPRSDAQAPAGGAAGCGRIHDCQVISGGSPFAPRQGWDAIGRYESLIETASAPG